MSHSALPKLYSAVFQVAFLQQEKPLEHSLLIYFVCQKMLQLPCGRKGLCPRRCTYWTGSSANTARLNVPSVWWVTDGHFVTHLLSLVITSPLCGRPFFLVVCRSRRAHQAFENEKNKCDFWTRRIHISSFSFPSHMHTASSARIYRRKIKRAMCHWVYISFRNCWVMVSVSWHSRVHCTLGFVEKQQQGRDTPPPHIWVCMRINLVMDLVHAPNIIYRSLCFFFVSGPCEDFRWEPSLALECTLCVAKGRRVWKCVPWQLFPEL